MTAATAARLRAVGLDPADPITRAIAADERQGFGDPLDPCDVRLIAHERYLRSGERPGSGPHWNAYVAAAAADEGTRR